MKLDIEIGSQEWLDLRRNKITATDAVVIMGNSPWLTPLELYHQKKSGKHLEQNEAMRRGILLESEAREHFNRITGHKTIPECHVHPIENWMMATLDGVDGVGIEIKCPGMADHETAILNIVPEKYRPQLQHQMEVMGLDEIIYVSYHPGHSNPFVMITVERDDEYIEQMLAKELAFLNCLTTSTPPESCERDAYKVVDEDFFMMERRLRDLQERNKEIEEEMDFLRSTLISRCPTNLVHGSVFKLASHSSKGAVEYSKIPELSGVDLEKYRKPPIQKWRLDLL